LVFEPLALPRAAREVAVPQRGRVTFRWHVTSPAVTNGLTAMNLERTASALRFVHEQ
jgi:hypothetical protein